jgi:hypothetical protein
LFFVKIKKANTNAGDFWAAMAAQKSPENPVPCNKAQTKIAFLDGLVNMKLN